MYLISKEVYWASRAYYIDEAEIEEVKKSMGITSRIDEEGPGPKMAVPVNNDVQKSDFL